MPEPPPSPRSTFHHGDLKAQALAAARERLAARGPDGLGLRELATALGVNHRALYRHFPDLGALIHQVAAAELAGLVDAMERAAQAEPQPALSLLWVATTTATTAIAAAPPINSRFGLCRAASLIPAGLPGASASSAARADEPIMAAAAARAIMAVL